ncbi:MAG TPA: thymidylate kinase [Candidatus Nanoarchaeia archaeon]|nr:thymidylate kinase [Candidatus Nanoarchaeia archaeon]
MKGKLIVIEGTDGSGKTVQTQLLMDRLRAQHVPVDTLSFPSYHEPSAVPVERYLRKEFGSPHDLGPYIPSAFYASDRLVKAIMVLVPGLEGGMNFVLNRYTGSNAGHQGGKIRDDAAREAYLNWLFQMEFEDMRIPHPDLTILLHLPASVGKQLAADKPIADSAMVATGGVRKLDAHEEDPYHLENAESAYLYVATKYPGWEIVRCLRPGLEDKVADLSVPASEKIRPREDIHEEVYRHVKELFTV